MSERGHIESFYNELMNLWLKERTQENLAPIPEDFENKLYAYASSTRQQLKVSDKKAASTVIKYAEFDIVKKLLSSLFEIRFRKIVRALLEGVQPENLLSIEKNFAEELSKLIYGYRERINSIAQELRVPRTDEKPAKYRIVCFMQAFPRVVCEDTKNYGPFRQYDIATLPPESARLLIVKQVARALELS